MNISRVRCCYCGQPRDFSTGWHDCDQAQEAKARLESLVDNIKTMHEAATAVSLVRLKRKREIAQNIKAIGGGVKPQICNGNN